MRIRTTGELLSSERKISRKQKPYYQHRVFIKEHAEIADVISSEEVPYFAGDTVDLDINVSLSGEKKVSCYFAQ